MKYGKNMLWNSHTYNEKLASLFTIIELNIFKKLSDIWTTKAFYRTITTIINYL